MIILQNKTEEHNPNWPQIFDHPYRILVLGGSGFGKTNALLNLIKQQDDDDYSVIKIYFYFRDQNEENINIVLKKVKTMVLKT